MGRDIYVYNDNINLREKYLKLFALNDSYVNNNKILM